MKIDRRISEYQRGWLEALIDGEGTFRLEASGAGGARGFGIGISIYNSDPNILLKAQLIIGGSITVRLSKSPKWKHGYILSVKRAETIRWLLPQIALVVKERQRLLFLDVLRIFRESQRDAYGRFRGSDVKKMNEYVLELRQLNQRGPVHEPEALSRTEEI